MMRPLPWSIALVPLAALLSTLLFDEAWWTADQQGQRLLGRGEPLAAAERFRDPLQRGAAFYRAGEFERCAQALSGVAGAEAAYNRGNALVFLGEYEQAVASYDLALTQRPDWTEARDNRALARSRERGPAEVGEASEVGADEIVFDEPQGDRDPPGDEVQTDGEPVELDDAALRALMLRNVRTSPGDFLRARFAWQAAQEQEQATAPAPAAPNEGEDDG